MKLISIQEWREKNKKDYKQGKSGYVAGNPRYNKSNKQTYSGKPNQTRTQIKQQDQKNNGYDK